VPKNHVATVLLADVSKVIQQPVCCLSTISLDISADFEIRATVQSKGYTGSKNQTCNVANFVLAQNGREETIALKNTFF